MSDVRSLVARRCGQVGAAVLLIGVGLTASAEAPKFDGRGWTVGNQQRNEMRSITEYVLPGQTVDNWKELVTSEVFFKPIPMKAFVEKLHASLAQGCPSLTWNVIRQDEKTAFVEWRDSGCGGFEPTSELARLTIEPGGLYRLAYSVKGSLKTERRKQWMAILGETPLAEGTAPGSARGEEASDPDRAALLAKVNQVLVAFVRQGGQACTSPSKVELKDQTPGPAGPLTEWLLECSDNSYTVLVQPNGAMTVFKAHK
jgi:hypothetical protein